MNNKIKNKRWRDESTPFIQPKSHEINPTPPPPTITWNPQPKKKKSRRNLHASPLVDLIGDAKLHGNGWSQWRRSRRRKKQKERERKREEGVIEDKEHAEKERTEK